MQTFARAKGLFCYDDDVFYLLINTKTPPLGPHDSNKPFPNLEKRMGNAGRCLPLLFFETVNKVAVLHNCLPLKNVFLKKSKGPLILLGKTGDPGKEEECILGVPEVLPLWLSREQPLTNTA